MKDTIIRNSVVFEYSCKQGKVCSERKTKKRFKKNLVISAARYIPDTIYKISINVSNKLGYHLYSKNVNSSLKVKPNAPGLRMVVRDEKTVEAFVSSPTIRRELRYHIQCCSKEPSDCHNETITTRNQTFSVLFRELRAYTIYNCDAYVTPVVEGYRSDKNFTSTKTHPSVPSKAPVVIGYQKNVCRSGECVTIYWKTLGKAEQNGSPFWYSVSCSSEACSTTKGKFNLTDVNFSLSLQTSDIAFTVQLSACNNIGCRESQPLLIPGKSDKEDAEVTVVATITAGGVNMSWWLSPQLQQQEEKMSIIVCPGLCKVMMDCECQEEPHIEETSSFTKSVHVTIPLGKPIDSYLFGVIIQKSARVYWSKCLYRRNGDTFSPKVWTTKEKEVCTLHIEKPACTKNSAFVARYEISSCSDQKENCLESYISANEDVTEYPVKEVKEPLTVNVRSLSTSGRSDSVTVECYVKMSLPIWALVLIGIFSSVGFAIVIIGCVYCIRYPTKVYKYIFKERIVFKVPERMTKSLRSEDLDGGGYVHICNENSSEVEESMMWDSLPTTPDNFVSDWRAPQHKKKGILDGDSSDEDVQEDSYDLESSAPTEGPTHSDIYGGLKGKISGKSDVEKEIFKQKKGILDGESSDEDLQEDSYDLESSARTEGPTYSDIYGGLKGKISRKSAGEEENMSYNDTEDSNNRDLPSCSEYSTLALIPQSGKLQVGLPVSQNIALQMIIEKEKTHQLQRGDLTAYQAREATLKAQQAQEAERKAQQEQEATLKAQQAREAEIKAHQARLFQNKLQLPPQCITVGRVEAVQMQPLHLLESGKQGKNRNNLASLEDAEEHQEISKGDSCKQPVVRHNDSGNVNNNNTLSHCLAESSNAELSKSEILDKQGEVSHTEQRSGKISVADMQSWFRLDDDDDSGTDYEEPEEE